MFVKILPNKRRKYFYIDHKNIAICIFSPNTFSLCFDFLWYFGIFFVLINSNWVFCEYTLPLITVRVRVSLIKLKLAAAYCVKCNANLCLTQKKNHFRIGRSRLNLFLRVVLYFFLIWSIYSQNYFCLWHRHTKAATLELVKVSGTYLCLAISN